MPDTLNRLGLLSAYKGVRKNRESYLKPEAESVFRSYAGYPVVSARREGLVPYFSSSGKHVSGMAIGGGLNDIDGPRRIVVNPYMFPDTASGNISKNALIKLEAARHKMLEDGYKVPDFKITPELEKWRKSTFKKSDPYYYDDKAFKETVISRIMVNDIGLDPKNPMPVPKEAEEAAMKLFSVLEDQNKKMKPSLSQSIQNLVFKK